MIRFCVKLERQWLNFVDWRGTSDGAKAYAYQKPWFVQKAFNPFKGIVFNDNSSIAAAEGIPIEQDPEYQRQMEFEKKKKNERKLTVILDWVVHMRQKVIFELRR